MAGSVGKEVCCITPCKSGMREFLHEVMLRSPYKSCTCIHIDILINKTVTSVIHQSTSTSLVMLRPSLQMPQHSNIQNSVWVLLQKEFRPPGSSERLSETSNLIYLIKLFHFELATILLPSYCGRVTQSNPELSDPLSLPSQFVLEIPSSPSEAGWQCHLPFQHLHWGTRFQSSHSHIKYLTARLYFNTL